MAATALYVLHYTGATGQTASFGCNDSDLTAHERHAWFVWKDEGMRTDGKDRDVARRVELARRTVVGAVRQKFARLPSCAVAPDKACVAHMTCLIPEEDVLLPA